MTRLAITALALLAAIVTACSPTADLRAVTVGGIQVANAADLLEQAEQTPPQTADIDERCFFTSFGDAEDISPLLRCGPKGNADKSRVGPWHALRLAARQEGDGIVLTIVDDFSIGWDLLPGESLVRPDDLEPLAPEGLPLPVATAFARGVNSLVGSLPLDFQRCMADEGYIVFDVSLVYDGMAQKLESEAIRAIGHDGHVTLSWLPVNVAAEAAATDRCIELIATIAGLDFERDTGTTVPATDS